ncbi:hypothetical protein D3C78_1544070 [compost metagenome]
MLALIENAPLTSVCVPLVVPLIIMVAPGIGDPFSSITVPFSFTKVDSLVETSITLLSSLGLIVTTLLVTE